MSLQSSKHSVLWYPLPQQPSWLFFFFLELSRNKQVLKISIYLNEQCNEWTSNWNHEQMDSRGIGIGVRARYESLTFQGICDPSWGTRLESCIAEPEWLQCSLPGTTWHPLGRFQEVIMGVRDPLMHAKMPRDYTFNVSIYSLFTSPAYSEKDSRQSESCAGRHAD
jgi:hypothetical protein